ncbi:hypothetical protein ACFE04_017867 [Oxalis oulophora]
MKCEQKKKKKYNNNYKKPQNGVTSISIECCIEREEHTPPTPLDGVGLQQMTPLFITSTSRLSRVRASKTTTTCTTTTTSTTAIASFHTHTHRGHRPFTNFNKQVLINNSDSWFVKVVCTLFLRSRGCVAYLSQHLTPNIELQVIKRLKNHRLGLKYLEFSRDHFKLDHSFGSYNILLRSLCDTGSLDLAKVVYDYMRIDGYLPDNSLLEFLVSSFVKAGKIDIAMKLIEEEGGSQVVYNNMLEALVHENQVSEAVSFFREHYVSKFRPDALAFNTLIKGLCRGGEMNKGLQFFKEMGSFGLFPDIITFNTIINGLCKTHQVDKGHEILMEGQLRDYCSLKTYTPIISGYSRLGKMRQASDIFNVMVNSGIKPDAIAFNFLIDGFGKIGDMTSAQSIYDKMYSVGCNPVVVTFNCLIDGYCRNGQVDQGLKLLPEMSFKNLTPNAYTYASLTNALCKANRIHEARDLLKELKFRDFIPKPFIYNPVIDGFCKAGNVDEANLIVSEMEENRCFPDKVTFAILVVGHCAKGRFSEAISIFNKMLDMGCRPDDRHTNAFITTFLKAGMPDEAFRIKKMAYEGLNTDLSSKNSLSLGRNTNIPVAV